MLKILNKNESLFLEKKIINVSYLEHTKTSSQCAHNSCLFKHFTHSGTCRFLIRFNTSPRHDPIVRSTWWCYKQYLMGKQFEHFYEFLWLLKSCNFSYLWKKNSLRFLQWILHIYRQLFVEIHPYHICVLNLAFLSPFLNRYILIAVEVLQNVRHQWSGYRLKLGCKIKCLSKGALLIGHHQSQRLKSSQNKLYQYYTRCKVRKISKEKIISQYLLT